MRQGEHVKFNEEMTKRVIDSASATYIPADKLLAFYLTSYLPIMSDCLASIADSLEILEKKIDEPKEAGNNNTKDDLTAMLTELQLDISELKSYESADGQDLVMLADIGALFQQKIDKLKGGKAGENE